MPSISSFWWTLMWLVRPSPDVPRPVPADHPSFWRYAAPNLFASRNALNTAWWVMNCTVNTPSAHERLRGSCGIRCFSFLPARPMALQPFSGTKVKWPYAKPFTLQHFWRPLSPWECLVSSAAPTPKGIFRSLTHDWYVAASSSQLGLYRL